MIIQSRFYDKVLDKSFNGHIVIDELKLIFGISQDEANDIICKWLKRRRITEDEFKKFNLVKPNQPLIQHPTIYEPKRQNRWLVRFPIETDIPLWVAHSTQRPRCTINNEVLTWDEMSISFRDPIAQSMAQRMYNLLQPPNNRVINYSLELLDPTGVCIENWVISGHITRVDFGELSMNTESIMDVTIFFSPIQCNLIF